MLYTWHLHSFVLKLQKVPMVISVPFSLQLLKVTSIYWVRLKEQQILETPTILIASFKQVMTNLCALSVTLLRKGKVCIKPLPVSPMWRLLAQRKTAKKRFNADTDDHCISKHARITPADHLSLPLNPSMGNRLHTVKQTLEADIYDCRSQSEDNY